MSIKRCNNSGCVSEWQDAQYGPKMRAMNKTTKPNEVYRCTVCGKENK